MFQLASNYQLYIWIIFSFLQENRPTQIVGRCNVCLGGQCSVVEVGNFEILPKNLTTLHEEKQKLKILLSKVFFLLFISIQIYIKICLINYHKYRVDDNCFNKLSKDTLFYHRQSLVSWLIVSYNAVKLHWSFTSASCESSSLFCCSRRFTILRSWLLSDEELSWACILTKQKLLIIVLSKE